ncbi:hypothetical protein WN944_013113 [Citrus x changshan-huyou]|uniref:Nodulin-like domain-containing protein n=1 Tax=Citrus x changshan-huyou TaxID=2935761 RepID=A0AAP0QKE7_9ROSI
MEEEMPSSKSKSKWMATQCSIGATYTFGIYSSTLKSTLNYDQSTLETVSVCEDIGGSAGVLSGLLFSSVTFNRHPRLRCLWGPWVVHLTLKARTSLTPLTLLPVSSTLAITAEPLWGYIGLSGAVLIQVQVYETICMGNPSTYILFLALFPTLVSLLLMGQVRIYGTNSLDDRKHLNGFAAIAVLFDVYFTVNTICDNLLSF